MTSTKVINAGVLTAAGEDISNPTKLALQATTVRYTLEVKVTNGASNFPDLINRLECLFDTSNETGTAAATVPNLVENCKICTAKVKHSPLAITIWKSRDYFVNGTNLFVWLRHGNLPIAAAVDVWLNEMT